MGHLGPNFGGATVSDGQDKIVDPTLYRAYYSDQAIHCRSARGKSGWGSNKDGAGGCRIQHDTAILQFFKM